MVSPNPVRLAPEHARLRSSDGIRCISAGVIAPIMICSKFVDITSRPSHAICNPPTVLAGRVSDPSSGPRELARHCRTPDSVFFREKTLPTVEERDLHKNYEKKVLK